MVGVIALWSVVPVLVKLLIPVVDPFTIAFVRLSQGAVTVVAVYLLRGRRLTDLRVGGWHVLGGFGIGANYALFSFSLSLTTASAGVLIVQVQYVTLTVLAALVLRERLGPRQVAAMGLDESLSWGLVAGGAVIFTGIMGLVLGERRSAAAGPLTEPG